MKLGRLVVSLDWFITNLTEGQPALNRIVRVMGAVVPRFIEDLYAGVASAACAIASRYLSVLLSRGGNGSLP